MLTVFLDHLAGIAGGAALLFAVFASIFEVSKIQINPWSRLFGFIGRAINKEVLEKVASLEEQVAEIKDVSDQRNCKMEEMWAKSARTRILRFGDECLHDDPHSKEHFDEILRDIKEYEDYCEVHPEFENNTAVNTIKLINEIYLDRMRKHDFL